jgi:hypothetical protein
LKKSGREKKRTRKRKRKRKRKEKSGEIFLPGVQDHIHKSDGRMQVVKAVEKTRTSYSN